MGKDRLGAALRRAEEIAPVEDDPTAPLTVRLRERNEDWLEQTMATVRKATGKRLTRSAVLRAVLDGVARANLDFAGVTAEPELAECVRAAICGSM